MGTARDELAKKYGTEVMSSLFTPKIDDYFRTSVKCGLNYDISWLSAMAVTSSGTHYELFRGYQKNSSNKFYGSVAERGAQAAPLIRPHYIGYTYFDKVQKNKILIRSYENPELPAFSIEITPGKYRWREGDDIDITYEALGPAMRFLTTGGDIPEDIYYTAEMCKLSGTILGEEVTGFGSMDQAWLSPGLYWDQNAFYICVEDIWIPFMNKYSDGSYEYGHFIKGREGWSMGYFVKDGVGHMNNDFTLDIDWQDGILAGADIDIDGHKFRWDCDTHLGIPEIARPHIEYAEGTMRNLSEDKELVGHNSWMEYRPLHLWDEPAHRI